MIRRAPMPAIPTSIDERLQPHVVRLRDSLGCQPKLLIGLGSGGRLIVSSAARVGLYEAERTCLEAALGLDDLRVAEPPESTDAGAQLLLWIASRTNRHATFERLRAIGRALGFPPYVEAWSAEQASDALALLDGRVRRASGG